jgi:1-acyl-sn-glycerol-3-phosphate acyltransferase
VNVAAAAPLAASILRAPRETTSPVLAAYRHQEAARAVCDLHGVETHVRGTLPEGPALLVANHLGYVDPIVLLGLRPCVALAKRDVAAWPFVGPRLRSLGVIFVDRKDMMSRARALRAMIRALRLGTSVLNFPEGTTSDGGTVLPFRRGAFGAARIAGVPVVPIRVDYDDPRVAWTGDATFLPHYAALLSRPPARAYVTVGEAIHPREGKSAREMADRARAVIREMPRP